MPNWAPASVSAADSDTEMEITRNNVPTVTVVDEEEAQGAKDPRALVRERLWGGLRRFSDSFSERDPRFIFEASFPGTTAPGDTMARDATTSEVALVSNRPRVRAGPRAGPRRRPLRPEDSTMSAGSSMALDSIDTNSNFMEWNKFLDTTLPQKKSLPKHRHEEFIEALNGVELTLSKVGLKGFGGLLSPVVGSLNVRFPLEDFLAHYDRTILLPRALEPSLNTRDLEKIENALFDTSKYEGHGNHMTVMTWESDRNSGNITLFEVAVTPPLRGKRAQAVRIHPVAAMEAVPKAVLVNMRVEHGLRRMIIQRADDQFKWKAQAAPLPPCYAKLKVDDTPLRRKSLRVDRYEDPRLADAHGVLATIPQFLGLMHTSRIVLETVRTTEVADDVETEGDGFVRRVTIKKGPRGKFFNSRDIHVVVLMPNEADWAEERIFWTSDDQLQDLRQRKYWPLVERGRDRSRSKSPSGSPSSRRSRSRSRSSRSSAG